MLRHPSNGFHLASHIMKFSLLIKWTPETLGSFCQNNLPYFQNGVLTWKRVPHHYDDVTMSLMASQITSLTIVYSTVYSGADQRKLQSSASLAFVWGIHRGPVNSPHKRPITRILFPFDDVIMIIIGWCEFTCEDKPPTPGPRWLPLRKAELCCFVGLNELLNILSICRDLRRHDCHAKLLIFM